MRRTPHLRLLNLLAIACLLAGCLQKAVWLPDGQRLAWIQDGSVWTVDQAGARGKLFAATWAGPAATLAVGGTTLALGAATDKEVRLVLFDLAGKELFTATIQGDALPIGAGAVAPDGQAVVLTGSKMLLVADVKAGKVSALPATTRLARFAADGSLLVLDGPEHGPFTLQHRTLAGAVAAKEPVRLPKATPPLQARALTPDGAIWLEPKTGALLIKPDGTVLIQSPKALALPLDAGPSYLTEEGGYALVKAGSPPTELNAVYNRLLRLDLNWQLSDPKAAAEKWSPPDFGATGLPVLSPDGTKIAVLTAHVLAVADLKTGEVTALAKW